MELRRATGVARTTVNRVLGGQDQDQDEDTAPQGGCPGPGGRRHDVVPLQDIQRLAQPPLTPLRSFDGYLPPPYDRPSLDLAEVHDPLASRVDNALLPDAAERT
ncbi:hypothetical protein [Streptomyces pinistramenti]|uniref:hypothetical protein n=1 Tax=Streptomyces pinistramenti TaxID=2884812 RepID=UPI001D081469|nr:hypothetical protein [Streptomyces pinistramenti]MCB5906996.1 hypothetical protein [Streptomyces pinistramenti]